MDQELENHSGTIGITEKNKDNLKRKFHNLIKVAKEKGFIFNNSKCDVKQGR